MSQNPKRSPIPTPVWVLIGLAAAVIASLVVYRPDHPVATIVPGSSAGPTFRAQIIRPRAGLPLGGVLPPQLFGVEEHLGFESTSPGASLTGVSPQRIEFGADDWDLALVLNEDGRVTSESYVIFNLTLANRLRVVRCSPGDPVIATFSMNALAAANEFSGSFDVDLAHCEDAESGTPLGWPSQPLVLHGSFDRLTLDESADRR